MARADVKRLLGDAGIVRNRLKIAATIQNAKAFLAVRQELESFDVYLWSFVGGKPMQNRWRTHGGGARAHGGIRCDEPRSGAAGIQVCGLDDLLRADASDGHGQRPPGDVSATRGTRRARLGTRDEMRSADGFPHECNLESRAVNDRQRNPVDARSY